MINMENDLKIITDLRDQLAGSNGPQVLVDLIEKFGYSTDDVKDFKIIVDALQICTDNSVYESLAPEMPENASHRLIVEYTFTTKANYFFEDEVSDTVLFVDVEDGELTGSY